jgi:GNAT superfamily N-acetyltransferase
MDRAAEAVVAGLGLTLRAMARLPSCGRLELGGGSFLLMTGTEAASENWVFDRSRTLTGEKTARACSFFAGANLPFVWPVLPDAGGAYRKELERAGLPARGELTAMARPASLPDRRTLPLTFERAATEETAFRWAETAWRAFGSPSGAPASFAALASGLGRDPDFRLILACRDGEPVGTFMLSFAGAGAGVYYFATLPEERGKGVGAAMMKELLRAASMSSGLVTLQATPSGAPFYASLGFEALFAIPLHSRAEEVF